MLNLPPNLRIGQRRPTRRCAPKMTRSSTVTTVLVPDQVA
jgi:hypothetical protein